MMPFTHPPDTDLLALAQHECDASTQRELLVHLADCSRCFNTVQAARDVQSAVRNDWTPSASASLLSRIQASRAAGAQVILADVDAPTVGDATIADIGSPSRTRWRYGFAMAVAASLVAVVASRTAPRTSPPLVTAVGASTSGAGTSVTPRAVASSRDVAEADTDLAFESASAFASALSPLPSVLQAQSGPPRASGPIYTGLDGTKLSPMTWRFATTRTQDDSIRSVVSSTTVTLERATFNKRPVWRFVTTSVGRAATNDTALLDPLDLRPIRRHQHVGRWTFLSDYAGSDKQRLTMIRSIANKDSTLRAKVDTIRLGINDKGVLIDRDEELQLLFKMIPLQRGWQLTHGRTEWLRNGSHSSLGLTRTLRVVGDGIVRTPFESIPVWHVAYDDQSLFTWYVSKANGDIVRTTGAWSHTNVRFQQDMLR